MVAFGFAISSEEHPPHDLVAQAQMAEAAGFEFAMISDHFHPWVDAQGHSPFVWTILGAIAQATTTLKLGTGVTCPTVRIHPAIVAQAAATTAALMPGRFVLGVGTGENLNEHIMGDPWPGSAVRRDMLEEAVVVMRQLWEGGWQSHLGIHYTIDRARLYTLPEEPVQVMVAASGPEAAELAGRIGDGFVGTSPDRETIDTFRQAGGEGKPTYGQLTVCWAPDEASARQTALEIWPNGAIPGELGQELPQPAHFQQAAQLVTEETIAESVVCGPDPAKHIEEIRKYIDAGYDHVYIHQVGPEQAGFIDFYRREVLPRVR